jgi:F0F1-type ATP synthase assembly protein I
VTQKPDDRSLIAKAFEWSSIAMTIALEMVVPILLGAWIDSRLGLKGVFVILGAVLGFTAGIWSLLRIAKPLQRPPSSPNEKSPPDKRSP